MLANERAKTRVPQYHSAASLKEADARYGLKRLMEQYGFAPQNGHWKSFTCPFCHKKSKAGVFEAAGSGVEMFKCQSTSCPSGAQAMPAVQFIAFHTSCSNKDAFEAYLKMAGVWKDRTKLKSPTPTRSAPSAPVSAADPSTASAGSCNEEPHQVPSAVQGGENADALQSDTLGGDSPPATGSSPAAEAPQSGVPAEPLPVEPEPSLMSSKEAMDLLFAKPTEPAPAALPAVEAAAPAPAAPQPADHHEPNGQRSLVAFYEKLTLSDEDEDKLYKKRGLEAVTAGALGFKSNPASNRPLLEELEKQFGRAEVLAAGLWLKKELKRRQPERPNSQFAGRGILRKLMAGEKVAKGEWADDDGHVWGLSHPVLIPYFDDAGNLIGLRPHKGMAPGATLAGSAKLYVPRLSKVTRMLARFQESTVERFSIVIVTEGEFKAAVLCQEWGILRQDGGEPMGVAAIPGIGFSRNYELREELDDWLRRVKCRHVIVSFDNEEKGDPKFPKSFKPDRYKRFDSQKAMRYLATDLAQKLHIRGEVGALPNEWRDKNTGKADWDGALSELLHQAK